MVSRRIHGVSLLSEDCAVVASRTRTAAQGTRSSSGCSTMSTRAPLRHSVISIRRPMACSTMRRCTSVALVTGCRRATRRCRPAGRRPWPPDSRAPRTRPASRPVTPTLALTSGRSRTWAPATPSQARRTRPGADERVDDLARRRVDRHGESHADAGDRRVDAHHAPGAVGEHAAAVAGVERGIRLDHLIDDATGLSRQRPAEPRDDAGGDAPGEPERVAERDHELADTKGRGIAPRHRRRRRPVGAEHCEVRERVAPDHARRQLGPVAEGDLDLLGACDHVRAGEQVALRRDH